MAIIGQFSQTVTINGVTYRVRDLNLSNDSDSRVAKVRFAIDPDSNRGGNTDSIKAGDQLVVSQNFDGSNKITSGIILTVNHNRAGNRDVIQIEGVSEEYQLQRVRFAYLWESTAADELIADAFARFAPGFGLSIENDPTVIESMEILYDSLYDLLQQVCRITGMAWRLENGTFYYFNPLSRTSGTIQQPFDIEGSTTQVSDSIKGVYNIARMQAYEFAQVWAEDYVRPGQCLDTLFVDQKWADWKLANSPIVQGVEFIDGRPEITANWSPDGEVKLSRGVTTPYENEPLLIRVRLKFKRLVWVDKIDQASIDDYGVLPAPAISGNDSVGIPAAEQILENYLAEKSRPIIKATMGLTYFDHDVDSICRLVYPSKGIDRELFVKSYSIATNGTITTVSVELVSPSDSELMLVRRSPDPVVDIEKRVTRLEKRRASLSNQQGEFAYTIGPIRFAPRFADNWGWDDSSLIRYVPNTSDEWVWGESVTSDIIPVESVADNWDWGDSVSSKFNEENADNWLWGASAITKHLVNAVDLWGWSESVTTSDLDFSTISDNWVWGGQAVVSSITIESVADNWVWDGGIDVNVLPSDNLSADNSVTVGTVGLSIDDSVTVGSSALFAGNDVTIASVPFNADNSVTLGGFDVDDSVLLDGVNTDESVYLDGANTEKSVTLGSLSTEESVSMGKLYITEDV